MGSIPRSPTSASLCTANSPPPGRASQQAQGTTMALDEALSIELHRNPWTWSRSTPPRSDNAGSRQRQRLERGSAASQKSLGSERSDAGIERGKGAAMQSAVERGASHSAEQ